MNLKKLLTMALVGALFVGTVATSSAAELDLAWYAAKNPDVVAAFGNSPEMLKLHYDMFGRKEARMANNHDTEAQLRKMFNPTEYAKLYPDVKAALGENAEAMFQHYMAFGLLESRRPSEKVSKATAANLKKAVEKALASAGIPAVPGSAQLVAALTGEIKADAVGGAAVQQALTQVASVVEKAVASTVQEVNNPSSGGGGGSSSSSSSNSSNSGSREPIISLTNETISGNSPANVAIANAACAGASVSSNDVSGCNPTTPTVLDSSNGFTVVIESQEIKGIAKDGALQENVKVITLKGNVPQHYNGRQNLGYWIGVAVGSNPKGDWDSASSMADAAKILLTKSADNITYDKINHQDSGGDTYYWGLDDARYLYLAVKDESGNVSKYIIDARQITLNGTHKSNE